MRLLPQVCARDIVGSIIHFGATLCPVYEDVNLFDVAGLFEMSYWAAKTMAICSPPSFLKTATP